MSLPEIPAEQWKPTTPLVTSTEANRSPATLDAIAHQFEVETQARYQPLKNDDGTIRSTWCNIYLGDTTAALGCEIPHWIDPQSGAPVAMGNGKETTANDVCDWLSSYGCSIYGWSPCSEDEATAAANAGQPAVITWKNPTGHSGHVALCLPTPDGQPLQSAQAGATNFCGKSYRDGFGDRQVQFYKHA